MKDKSFEIIPGVRVTECSDWMNLNKRLEVAKYKQFIRDYHANGIPEQDVRYKVARSKNWLETVAVLDPKTKSMHFEVMLNANTTEHHSVSYEEICELFHWESFKLTNNNQTIKPKLDFSWFESDWCEKHNAKIAAERKAKKDADIIEE